MKVGNIVILANLGELKAYEANPRTLEAEAGLKENEVKLDLITDKNYIESHQKLHEILSDQAGQFKGGSQGRGSFTQGSIGEKHSIEEKIEEDLIREIAHDISELITQKNAKSYIAIPATLFNRVMDQISANAKEKIIKAVEKDYMKVSKGELVELFSA